MALNVKAALLVCAGFISGLCWLVDRVALPLADAAPPLVVLRPRAADGYSPAVGPYAEAPPIERPTYEASLFTHGSPFERQAAENRGREARLAALALPPPLEAMRPVALPPLSYVSAVEVAPDPTDRPASEPPTTLAAFSNPGPSSASDTHPSAAAQVESAPTSAPRQYTVSRGDSLTKIARRHWSSDDLRLVQLLIAANPDLADHPDRVLVGDQLLIPGDSAVQRVLDGVSPAQALAGPTPDTTVADARPLKWYTIRARDSLMSIARRHLKDGRRWREIAELNGLSEPRRIVPGMRIKLPPLLQVARG